MRSIELLVVHCSATRPDLDIGAREIDTWHRNRGWDGIGYHDVIRRDGTVEDGRPLKSPGAHARGHNANSIGVCLIGGVNRQVEVENNFTDEQFDVLEGYIRMRLAEFPSITKVCGHRDLSPDLNGDGKITSNEWLKGCPSFDVTAFLKERNITV